MEKTISFIIPAYNVEKYLDKGLSSFLNSDVMDQLEVIIVNDGSNDATEKIARFYTETYPSVYKLINKKNGGHGSAINSGSQAASGKFFKVVDGDDWVMTQNLPLFINKLSNCDADVVLTPFHMIDMTTGSATVVQMDIDDYTRSYSLIDILNNWNSFSQCLTLHGITYHTEFYNRNRHELPEHIFYEDQEYSSIPCCYAKKFTVYPFPVYQYLVGNSEQSISQTNQLRRIGHLSQVIENLMAVTDINRNLDNAAKTYLELKTEKVILSYYTVSCLINPAKAEGRRACKKLNEKIVERNPDLLKRVQKKYWLFRCMSRMSVSYSTYIHLIRWKNAFQLKKRGNKALT